MSVLWSGLIFHKTLTDTDLKSIIPNFISSTTVYVSFFLNQLTLTYQFSLGERYPALTQAENVTIILITIIDGGMSQVYYYYY